MAIVDIDRLKANLLTSGLQNKDSALFQVINQLIEATKQLQGTIITQIITGGGGSGGGLSGVQSFVTINTESSLVNSRMLVAGNNITFDVSVPGQLIINAVSITVYQQHDEPLGAIPGDIWIS